MTEKIKPKTKAELLEMLAEAVRNTQPQSVRNAQPEPVNNTQPAQRKTLPRNTRRSARPKSKAFGHLLAARSSLDNAVGDLSWWDRTERMLSANARQSRSRV
jgi:hypothetical protein